MVWKENIISNSYAKINFKKSLMHYFDVTLLMIPQHNM